MTLPPDDLPPLPYAAPARRPTIVQVLLGAAVTFGLIVMIVIFAGYVAAITRLPILVLGPVGLGMLWVGLRRAARYRRDVAARGWAIGMYIGMLFGALFWLATVVVLIGARNG